MKKFLFLSLIMLCTAMSAWSETPYTTGSVTLSVYDADSDTGTATDPNTGISVKSTEMWVVGGRHNGMLILEVPFFYVVTGVSFKCDTEGKNIACDNLVWNAESNEWVQANGALTYNSEIYFQNDTEEAMVFSVTITYHKHDFNLYEECYHEGVAATCTTPGMMEYWECSDCRHIYSENNGTSELSRTSLEIPATNHKNKIYVEAKPATDTEDGYTVDHWHCPDCGKNFADEDCTEQITDNVIIRAKNRDWLCFTANTSSSTVQLNKVGDPYEAAFEFTTTETTWEPYTFGQTITLTDAGDKVFFRKADEGVASGFSNNQYQYSFAMTGKIAASGNVMSLIDNTCEATTIPNEYCFAKLFYGCESLTSAPRLPATTLKGDCYYCMFLGCTNLTTPPVLPATTLAASCYSCMFSGCTKLATAPMLPATTLKEWCYSNMFKNCTSLTTAPELPVTTLAEACYANMFEGCTGLTAAPFLPATTMATSCYALMFKGCTKLESAPALASTALAEKCYMEMFEGCTSLTAAPALPATELKTQCYQNMFSGCTNLKSAPTLAAMKMLDYCYSNMFKDCTSLTTAPSLPATTLAFNCYMGMFSGCSKLEMAPELPATGMYRECYKDMFKDCTSLTTAPELPATEMKYHCYYGMFSGCTNLNHVKVAFTKWTDSSTYIPENWLNGVASTGTFVCPDALDKSQTGASYIPEGWTPAFEVKANKDPESVNYYSTFYSGTNAYEVPSGVTAYTGVAEGNVLKLTAIESGVIPAEEPVILKASQSQVYLPYTTTTATKSTDNKLSGTDVAKTLGANEYALSLGQNGVGFYLWNGKSIDAHKAYLTLPASSAKAFTFQFEDGASSIHNAEFIMHNGDDATYNLNGMRVNDNYKGIVIVNGKKVIK